MATTASTILKDSLINLGQLRINSATGGSTVSVVDSNLGGDDDDFNGGTLMIITDAAGAAAAPESQFAEVSDYTESSGTIAIAVGDAFTASPVSGDIYGVSNGKDFPHFQMIQAINRALQSLGDYPHVDTTTLDTASSKTEYAYAVAWKRTPPYRVDIQIKTTDADDNQWREISRGKWYYVPAVAGSTGLIIFKEQLPSSRDLRIWYKTTHTFVDAYDDTIYEGFHPELVVWQTVYEALLWKNGQQPGDDGFRIQLNNAENKRAEMTARHKVWMPKRATKLFIVSRADVSRDRIPAPDPP